MQEKKNIIQAKGLWKSLINSAIYCLLHMLMCSPPPMKLLWQKDSEMERKQKINTHHFKEGQTHKKRTKDFWPWIKNYLAKQPLEILFWFFPLFPFQKYSEISAQPAAVPWTRLSLKSGNRPQTTVTGLCIQKAAGQTAKTVRHSSGWLLTFVYKEGKRDCTNKTKLGATKVKAGTCLGFAKCSILVPTPEVFKIVNFYSF